MDDTAIKVPTTVTTTKVNPILKKDPHHPPSGAPQQNGGKQDETGAAPSSPGKEKKHLTWDEHAIEEHDLLRGTRMKIDEPNTPYTHYDHHSDDEASHTSGQHPRSPDENHPSHPPALSTQFDSLASKLQAVADKRDAAPLSPTPSRDSNMSDDEAKKEHDKKFRDMRKKHYNEVEAMRRWRAEHANDEDEDDEDDEDDDDDMEE